MERMSLAAWGTVQVILLWTACGCSNSQGEEDSSQDLDTDTGEEPESGSDEEETEPDEPDGDIRSIETDSDTKTDLPVGSPIAELGLADLTSNRTAAMSPLADLPELEGEPPVYTPVLEGQSLPTGSETIHGLEEIARYGDIDTEQIEDLLRTNGLVRFPTGYSLMSESLTQLSDAASLKGAPGVFVTSDAVIFDCRQPVQCLVQDSIVVDDLEDERAVWSEQGVDVTQYF